MTGPGSVPGFACRATNFRSNFRMLRCSKSSRPVSDRCKSCPKIAPISLIIAACCGWRPACDTGAWPASDRRRARQAAWRAASARRAFSRSAWRRFLSWRARRFNRQALLQVFWVVAAEGAGTYRRRHSQQRRGARFDVLAMPRRSQAKSPETISRRRRKGGSLHRRWVDLG